MSENITNNDYSSFDILLPKKIHESKEGAIILTNLKSRLRPVMLGIDFMTPLFPVSPSIMNALFSARRAGRLIRGFEYAEKKLTAERAGIVNVDNRTGSERVEPISRIVVIGNDGSERFYRQVKKLIEQNQPRVLAIHLDITSFELGERLFGPGKRALFLLINHKEPVINFLTSLIK